MNKGDLLLFLVFLFLCSPFLAFIIAKCVSWGWFSGKNSITKKIKKEEVNNGTKTNKK